MRHIPQPLLAHLETLPQELQAHTRRVRRVARELADAHGLDPDRAELAAAGHDIARAYTAKRLLARARALGLPMHPVDERRPVLLHGPVGAQALRDLGVTDEEVLQGVYWHSTANSGLSPLGRLTFLADKLDPQKVRRYSFLEEIRGMALQDLDAAVIEFLNQELSRLLARGYLIHPASIEARNELLARRDSP